MNKTIHIKRTIDIEITVPMDETREETEQWVSNHFRPDGTLERIDMDHIIRVIRMESNDDAQDSFIVVSWPESQELCEYEGYQENCSFVMGDSLPCCSYLVNKNWYSMMTAGKLAKAEEYAECEAI